MTIRSIYKYQLSPMDPRDGCLMHAHIVLYTKVDDQ